MIDLARTALVTHERDLDAFSSGDKNDVRLIDVGDGVQFACIGTVPERRYPIPAIYGLLTLKNGVPIGYYQISAIFHIAEIAFTIFSTYRGAEASKIFACALAVSYQLFGIETFALDPYQLGHNNKDGLKSGVWWFYYKLGFRPKDRGVRQVLRDELKRMKLDPEYRSDFATLNKLSTENMYFEIRPNAAQHSVLPLLWNISPGISAYLANNFAADREAGIRACSEEAARLLGLRTFQYFSRHERQAWDRWSPLVVNLPGIKRWSNADRKALVKVIAAKGGHRESEFLKLFDRHKRLQNALLKFAIKSDTTA